MIFFYNERTRYGINALLASIDSLGDIRAYLISDLEEILRAASSVKVRGGKCIVALSLLTTMLAENDNYIKFKDAVDKLKRLKCIVVGGGPHVTGDPLGSLHSIGLDYAFIGEAERSFRDFILAIQQGLDERRVRGIAYLSEDSYRFIFTGRDKPIELDSYNPFPYWRGILSPIEITRGCPHGCFYCQVSYMHGFQYRHRSVERVLFYVRELMRRGCTDIRFITPNGLAYGLKFGEKGPNLGAIEDLLSSIKNLIGEVGGRVFLGTFPSEVRPDYITEESLKVLKRYVANRNIIIGAQSGSDRILKRIHRSHSVEDVLNATTLCIRHGFTPHVDLILGLPDESVEDMEETLNLAKKIVTLGGKVHLHYFLPLPGTPLGGKSPTVLPERVRKELLRFIGLGKAYGNWLKQERVSWRLVNLRLRGIIGPTTVSSAP